MKTGTTVSKKAIVGSLDVVNRRLYLEELQEKTRGSETTYGIENGILSITETFSNPEDSYILKSGRDNKNNNYSEQLFTDGKVEYLRRRVTARGMDEKGIHLPNTNIVLTDIDIMEFRVKNALYVVKRTIHGGNIIACDFRSRESNDELVDTLASIHQKELADYFKISYTSPDVYVKRR